MKIGTCVNFSSPEEIPAKLAVLKDNGFDSCQLISWTTFRVDTGKRPLFKGAFKRIQHRRLRVLVRLGRARDLGFFMTGSSPSGWFLRNTGKCASRTCATERISLTVWGFRMWSPTWGFNTRSSYPNFHSFCVAVRTVAQHLKKNGQYLLFETGQETPVTLLRCFETVGMDNLGINLDTANLILYGKANPVDALDVFGKYVRNLHAKDGCYPTNGHDLGIETRLGEGKVDFRALFSRLKELGYDSHVTIEREISGPQQLADILDARNYLQTIIDEIYGGASC